MVPWKAKAKAKQKATSQEDDKPPTENGNALKAEHAEQGMDAGTLRAASGPPMQCHDENAQLALCPNENDCADDRFDDWASNEVRHNEFEEYSGKVKWFSSQKGFGYIECPALFEIYGKDAFVSAKSLREASSLNPGDEVSFFAKVDSKGVGAVNVWVQQHAQVKGSQASRHPAGMQFRGFVKDYNSEKGFGFISCTGTQPFYGNKAIFVHCKQLNCRSISQGDLVQFEVAVDSKGPSAVGVVLLTRAPPPQEKLAAEQLIRENANAVTKARAKKPNNQGEHQQQQQEPDFEDLDDEAKLDRLLRMVQDDIEEFDDAATLGEKSLENTTSRVSSACQRLQDKEQQEESAMMLKDADSASTTEGVAVAGADCSDQRDVPSADDAAESASAAEAAAKREEAAAKREEAKRKREQLEEELQEVKKAKKKAVFNEEFSKAGELRAREQELEQELERCQSSDDAGAAWSREDLQLLPSKELKALLAEAGLSSEGCLEKAELVDRLLSALE
eukprot:TRINITY_DN76792_c0_g1_i1.p1 TRINITY_DN76792_c0_g1~~TRINITY_DN76792_c0_g1_i1.p1  ORF type:complete len:505 (+),score=127.53 TRINITY_DN76792_c0_g1_i1:109-1623(+)